MSSKFGKAKRGEWIAFDYDLNFYIDEENIKAAKVSSADVEAMVKSDLLKEPHFTQVMTRSEMLAGQFPVGDVGRRAGKTYFEGRSGNVIAFPKPFYINKGKHKATHLTSYTYDRMVPLIISGFESNLACMQKKQRLWI